MKILRFQVQVMLWMLLGSVMLLACDMHLASLMAINTSAALASEKVDVSWPHSDSDLKPDPCVVFGELPNGFRYVLMKNIEPRDRVSMHLNVQAGSFHEAEHQRGLAHFLEHLLFCGSTHFPPGELIRYFQSIGMRFGADANAHTGFYATVYDVLLPHGDQQSLEKALLVMQDYAEGASLLPSEIDRERHVILAEKRTRDSAAYRTFEAILKFELPDSRISNRLPIGLEQVVQKADRETISAFYDTWYRPEKMILVVVGDFDTDLARQLIRERFSPMNARTPQPAEPDFGEIRHTGINAFYHYEQEAGKTNVSISVLQKQPMHSDSFDHQRQHLIQSIADRLVAQRLDSLLDKPGTPFTTADIGSGTWLNAIQYGEISAECAPGKWKETLSLLEHYLRSAMKYGFTASELERVKKEYLSELENDVKQSSTRDSTHLARKILGSLNNNEVFQSPAQKNRLFAPIISTLTLQAVNTAFRKTWAPAHRLLIVTGNVSLAADQGRPETIILKAFQDSQAEPVTVFCDKAVMHFPYLPVPKARGTVVRQEKIAASAIRTVDFANGLRLNLKPTDFQSDKILFTLAFDGGRASEPLNMPGLAQLSTAVINESGLGEMPRNEIKRALADKETELFFSVRNDCFAFSGSTVRTEIELLFQLLQAYLQDPAYRQDAYDLVQRQYDQKYEVLCRTAEGALQLYGERFLAGGDPRFGLPSHDNFRKNTLADVKVWLSSALNNSAPELSIVGDFEPQVMIDMAQKYLGGLPIGNKDIETTKVPPRIIEFPQAQSLNIKIETQIPKGLVIVAYPTDDFWDIQQTRRLTVLSEIFSEKLRKKIREKLGASYSPYAYNNASRAYQDYGVLQAVIQVNPDQCDMVAGEVRTIAADLSKNGIADEELQLALKPILTQLKDMRRDNTYWLKSVLMRSRAYPQQLEWCLSMMDDFASITADELTALARKYLDNQKSAVITIQPE